MTRPRVTIHNTTSIDGQLAGFPIDQGLHREVASWFGADAMLVGCRGPRAYAHEHGVDLDAAEVEAPPHVEHDPRLPWLVLLDASGRVKRLSWLRRQEEWRDVVVLCSDITPPAHLEQLRKHGVPHIVNGPYQVDLASTLDLLADRFAIQHLLVNSRSSVNGQLMHAGLVDEVSIILAPYLVENGLDALGVFAGTPLDGIRHLRLTSIKALRDDHAWLRYATSGGSTAAALQPATGVTFVSRRWRTGWP